MISSLVLTTLLAASLDADVRAIAALPGDPGIVSAAGLTKADVAILSIENDTAFAPAATERRRRLVVVGTGPGDNDASAQAVLDVIRWFKTTAPRALRDQWTASALPAAAFDPEDSASLERWITFQVPDLLIEISGTGTGIVPASIEPHIIPPDDAVAAVRQLLNSARPGPSPLHLTIANRIDRRPIDIATVLATRYPGTPSISYIPSVAWSNTLRVAAVTGDRSLIDKVREQTLPWIKGQPLFGQRVQLTSVAGTMIFAELGGEAAPLAIQGAALAAARKADGIAEHGQGWTDDMFMASAVLSRTAAMPGRTGDLDAMASLLADYARRLQRPDGIFVHAVDGPFAWGRGNGFAAFGLMEALTAMPQAYPRRAELLAIFVRHMEALKAHQAPDGMWREVIDEPGAYREETATAMLLTAMARGLRLGWLDRSFTPVVERAWRGLAAHVEQDGAIIDVCTGTGVGPTKRYYLDRAAIRGADDRGGAMALFAAMEYREWKGR